MDKQNLMPQAAQPVTRIATGQLPAELAELSEEALSQDGGAWGGTSVGTSVLPTGATSGLGMGDHCDLWAWLEGWCV